MHAVLIHAAIVAVTVAGMEVLANLTHRHVMHGWGWGWHRSHHEPGDGVLEVNDLYAVVFGALATVLFVLAMLRHWSSVYWAAIGLSVYGVLYFVLHDGLVHGRWPFRIVPRHGYLKRLVQAHRLHHAIHGRDGAVSFGFLYAQPVDRLKARLQRGGRA